MTVIRKPETGDIVALALSGGVDSAVSASVLMEAGYRLRAFHMILNRDCNSLKDAEDAANSLGIDLEVYDIADEFERLVVTPFISAYTGGETPSPCVLCNPVIKFGLLARHAFGQGADFLATGHYARLNYETEGGTPVLTRPKDRRKDQLYFLSRLTPGMLSRVIFPLADFTKDEIKEKAVELGIKERGESQEICFLGDEDYRSFLRKRLGAEVFRSGDFVDVDGRKMGRHRGLVNYTIGQRRGLGIPGPEPYYVVGLDPKKQRVIIGTKKDTFSKTLGVKDIVWSVAPKEKRFTSEVQIRSRHRPAAADVRMRGDHEADVEFLEPQSSITPGQAAAFFHGDVLMGGGWIK